MCACQTSVRGALKSRVTHTSVSLGSETWALLLMLVVMGVSSRVSLCELGGCRAIAIADNDFLHREHGLHDAVGFLAIRIL